MRNEGGGGGRELRLTGTGPAGPAAAAGSAKSGQSLVARAGATCTGATCRVARQFFRELRISMSAPGRIRDVRHTKVGE